MDKSSIIDVCKQFVKEIEVINKNPYSKDLTAILNILNCLQLDDGWHWGLRYAEKTDFGDKSWFYCYHGEKDTYCEDYRKPIHSEDGMDSFWKYYNYNPIYEIFKHTNVEKSEMGIWQAYLLSKATFLLPTWWHGAYSRRQFILCEEDTKRAGSIFVRLAERLIIPNLNVDFKPEVIFDGVNATISCCFWNDWQGLFREIVRLSLIDGKVIFVDENDKEILYKYKSGIVF
jgi:hypothetical protein